MFRIVKTQRVYLKREMLVEEDLKGVFKARVHAAEKATKAVSKKGERNEEICRHKANITANLLGECWRQQKLSELVTYRTNHIFGYFAAPAFCEKHSCSA